MNGFTAKFYVTFKEFSSCDIFSVIQTILYHRNRLVFNYFCKTDVCSILTYDEELIKKEKYRLLSLMQCKHLM